MSIYDDGLIDLFSGNAEPTQAIEQSDDEFVARIAAMIDALPDHLKGTVRIRSAWRSEEEQAWLYDRYQNHGGNLAAPPGRSNHNHGLAMDLEFTTDAARRWAHENAERFGLTFPIESEDWHIEPLGLRDGTFNNGDFTFEHDHEHDEDMYGGPMPDVDNTKAETQLLRVADMLMGGTYRSKARLLKDPRQLAENNLKGGTSGQ